MQFLRNGNVLHASVIGLLITVNMAGADVPVQLTCEYRTDPYGIDIAAPQLSWQVASTTRGQRQTAYRILVSSSEAALSADSGDMWNSGKVTGDQSTYVTYAGSALASGKRYYWKVRVWDKNGTPTGWSDPAMWCMGKLTPGDWKGHWIGGQASLSKGVAIAKPVARATVFMCGLTCSELSIGGIKVGHTVAGPGITAHPERVFYVVEDVTGYLPVGTDTVSVVLDACASQTGYVGDPKLLLDLDVEYADGTAQTFSSDSSWTGAGTAEDAPAGILCARPMPPLVDSPGGTHLDVKSIGSFSCSNTFFNTLQTTDQNSIFIHASDFWVDGTREPIGWTENAQNMMETVIYNSDVPTFYRKWWYDMRDMQAADGSMPEICPQEIEYGDQWNSPWWGGCIAWIPWTLYEYYGDIRFIQEGYGAMKAYVDYLDTKAGSSHLVNWFGLSEWNCWPAVSAPAELINTMGFYFHAKVVSRAARLLGNTSDAQTYAALAAAVGTSLNAKYFDTTTGLYQSGSQGSQAMALCIGLVPDDKRVLAQQGLVSLVHDAGDHVGTGFVTGPFLFQALLDADQADLLYTMVNQPTFPGWRTVLAGSQFGEDWSGGGNPMPGLAGCVGLYLFQGLGGIRPDTASPGFKRTTIYPMVVPDLTSTNCSFVSPFGTIASNWSLNGTALTMDITIPPNTTASVYIPSDSVSSVKESGQPAGSAEGVTFSGTSGQRAVYSVQSGVYHFTAYFRVLSTRANKQQPPKSPEAILRLRGIRWAAGASSEYRVEVFSASGRSVYGLKGKGPAAGFLPLKQFSSGVYFVSMRQGGETLTQRMIVPAPGAPTGSRQ